MENIIIIGAGAAGLMAARTLVNNGEAVTILEARDRIGGRIFTAREDFFSAPVETGAEFIHGELPCTIALAKEAGGTLLKDEGRSWTFANGEKVEEDITDDEGWSELTRVLKTIEQDMTVADVLNTYFSERHYEGLRQSVTGFVQGFDAADINKASAFALREELNDDSALVGYHIKEGHSLLVDFLLKELRKKDVSLHLSTVVKEIHWKNNSVSITTEKGDQFFGKKALITIPPAVLKTKSVRFVPAIPSCEEDISKIETGGVIKFVIEFTEPFWEKENDSPVRKYPDLHFLFSDAFVPTWWTKKPLPIPVLTGWLSGPITQRLQKNDNELIEEAILSLAYLFSCTTKDIKSKMKGAKVYNWLKDPFALGAYAYKTIHSNDVLARLSNPIEDTLYFAGEAYHQGEEGMGTVNAALVNGEEVARKMLT